MQRASRLRTGSYFAQRLGFMISAPSSSKKLRVRTTMETRPETLVDDRFVIVTHPDPGCIQEETPALGVLLLITPSSTERPEAVFSGAAEWVGIDRTLSLRRTSELPTQASSGLALPARANPFKAGTSSKKNTHEIIARYGAKA